MLTRRCVAQMLSGLWTLPGGVSRSALVALLCAVPAPAERLLDQMRMVDERRYTSGHGNHTGGVLVFGKNYSLQVTDDFYTTSTGYVITEVEVGNLTFGVEQPAAAWVSIYEEDGRGKPREEAVYDVRHIVTRNTPFDDPVFGLVGMKTTIGGLAISLRPNSHYFVSVQTESRDWAYTAVAPTTQSQWARTRDNGRNGYQGAYGWTTWRRTWDPEDAAYRIEAVPEPEAAALLLMLAGAACAVRRRRPG